jgi:transcriptional regulator with XRE-family HTH domain
LAKTLKAFLKEVKTMKYTLKQLRVGKGLRQTDVAVALGVNRKTIAAWENGISLPTADKIDAICELFGVSYDDIQWKV